jgi:hypothetical protein
MRGPDKQSSHLSLALLRAYIELIVSGGHQ